MRSGAPHTSVTWTVFSSERRREDKETERGFSNMWAGWPQPGTPFRGAAGLRAGLEKMFAHDAATRSEITDVFAVGDRVAWEWRYYDAAGNLLARGCDLFVLRDGRIARKNAFRKTTA